LVDYTSGRVISRQTSDVDAIYEMLETGFDGLVTAALTLAGTAGILLVLDVKLGLVALACGPFPAWLTNWFRTSSAESYRLTREKVALVIIHFVESMGGIRAVQAFRREPSRTSSAPPRPSEPTTSSPRCRTATTPTWPTRAGGSARVSDSWSPSRARSSPTPPC
jgi:ABC-type multidrug transport system fused ATPase/permease subunit